jgi:uncharacterized cysteine cluster protein YcgN (CxxCxxCC family)
MRQGLTKATVRGFVWRMAKTPFWQRKTLDEMTRAEWESLCDGCAKCCLVKLEDEDTLAIEYTSAACKLLDCNSCQCSDYKNRQKHVPDCVKLTPGNVDELHWMPPSCAYRLLSEGKDLPSWHPLVSGELNSVVEAGMSVKGRVVSEADIDFDDICDFIVEWPKYVAD